MKIGKEISDYVNGRRSGGTANRLERDALSDPFLFEALEGLTEVEGEHGKVLEVLDDRLKTRHRPKRRILAGWMVAASVVLVGGIALMMLYQEDGVEEEIRRAEVIISAAQDSLAGDSSLAEAETAVSADSLLVAAAAPQQEEAVVVRRERKAAHSVSQELADFGEYGAEEDGASVKAQSVDRKKSDKKIVPEGTGAVDGAVGAEKVSFVRSSASSRKRLISGRILGKQGIPVVGAVVQGGKNTGTVTDENGQFQIEVPFHTRELSVSFIGMKSKKQAVPENGQVEIVMEQDQAVLAETVVAGNSRRQEESGSRKARKRERKNYLTPNEVKRFNEYARDSLRYPVGCKERGEIILSFRINKQGRAFNVKMEQGIGPECDREAVRLLRAYEGFTPVSSISERLRLKMFFPPSGKK